MVDNRKIFPRSDSDPGKISNEIKVSGHLAPFEGFETYRYRFIETWNHGPDTLPRSRGLRQLRIIDPT